MHNVRPDFTNGPSQTRPLKPRVAVRLTLADYSYLALRQTIGSRAQLPDRVDYVLEARRVKVLDQGCESVLESSFPQVIYHVHDPDRHELALNFHKLQIEWAALPNSN
jgi:hypothetical protein